MNGLYSECIIVCIPEYSVDLCPFVIFAFSTSVVSSIFVAKLSTCDSIIYREYFPKENVLGVEILYLVYFSLTNTTKQLHLLKIFITGV